MDDVELLRQALESLEDPTLNMHELQSRIAPRRASPKSTPSAAPAGEPSLGATLPTLPGR